MNEPPVIHFDNVSFSYNGAPVLEGANLTVAQRDYACIVGPNGGGKTTLLKLALGLLQPKAGTIRVFGLPPENARPRVGYTPQNVLLDPAFPATVRDVVRMGRLDKMPRVGPFSRADNAAAEQALADVGMLESVGRPLARLSGGQRQRVLIARALAAEPELLLLDEPTANLDPQAERDFLDLLSALNQRLTIVMVSHDLGYVSPHVKTVHCVNKKIVVHPTGEAPEGMRDSLMPGARMILHDRHDPRCECGDDK